jgi:ribosomal protein L2
MKSRFTVLRELLIKNTKYMGGRNSRGKITVYHKGGRHKRFFRWVD